MSGDSKPSKNCVQQQLVVKRLVKRAPNVEKFPPDSAPFHVPHLSCLTRRWSSSDETGGGDDGSLICNLREPTAKNVEGGQAEIKKKPILIKKAIFTLNPKKKPAAAAAAATTILGPVTPRRPGPPKLVDLDELFATKVEHFTDDSFIYLTYTMPRQSEYFTAYALTEVAFLRVNRQYYYTVSRHGVTLFSRYETQFTALSVWRREYRQYQKLKRVPTFARFRLWKGFKVWQKGLVWRKFAATRNFLQENLFLAIEPLARAALRLRAECCRWVKMSMVDISPNVCEAQHLFYFVEAQMLRYELARDALLTYRSRMMHVLYEACVEAIVARGFLPYDEALVYTTVRKLREMMSYTELTRKRRFCILLVNFLSYCDHITISHLHEILHDAFHKLAKLFRMHDSCAPTDEQLGADNQINRQLEPDRPAGLPARPLFVGDLLLRPDRIEVDPSHANMHHIISQFDGLVTESVRGVQRFQSDDKFRQFSHPSIRGRQEDRLGGQTPNIDTVLDDDVELTANRRYLSESLQRAYETVNVYVQRFEPIRLNYQQDVATDPRAITFERDVLALRRYCERYTAGKQVLDGVEPSIRLGMLELRQGLFAEEVIPVCSELLVVLDTHIPKLAIAKVADLARRAASVTIRLDTQPTELLGFVEFMQYFEECDKQIEQMMQEIDYAYDCFMLMKDYNLQVDDVAKEEFMDCEDAIIVLKDVLQQRIDSKPELIQKMNTCMQEDIQRLFIKIESMQSECVKEWLIDSKSDRTQVSETLTVLAEQIAQCVTSKLEYSRYQREYKLPMTRYELLDRVSSEVKNRQLLWDTAAEWDACHAQWYEESFNSLNVADITDVSSRLQKTAAMLEKNLPPNAIAPRVRNEVELFREKLPTIQFLRNPALKTRHWLKIEQIIDRKVFQDDTVTLQLYEDAGAFVPVEATGEGNTIAEVSSQASAEASLEQILKKVEMLWKETDLSVVAHRDAKDVFILGGIDELQLAMDESNVNINTLAASRHVGPIRGRVTDWQRMLDLFANTLEEWTMCQTSWIYLEAIFSAPDIQRQLPAESRMFLAVDRSWKDIMRRCYKQPLALPQMTDPQTYVAMKNNNELLDKITKCLEAYLELKRVVFPRFYFLSNDELLEILAQTRNPHAVQPHLRKCFDAIALLQFGIKDAGGEGGNERQSVDSRRSLVQTTDIVALLSPEGECIKLGGGLRARGSVEDWLGKVEEAMFTALRRCMKFGYRCYPTKERTEWMQEHPNQVVLTVSQQQWAVDVHAIFDNDRTEQRLQKMSKFEKKLISDLTQLAAMARTDISKLLRRVLCALITIDVHARDTIASLVANRVTDPGDFNWLRMLRYYWESSTETMQAQMSASEQPYYYEYLGAGGVLVITPLTDRCYLCLMGALQMDLGGAPAGPAGTGKTETTKDLAKALAKQCVVFNCSEGLDYQMMGRFFSGLAQCGAWCCFDEFNRIDIEVLSVIAQQLITIRQAKAGRLRRFMFEGREIKLNRTCAAFITMNPGYAGRTELPDNLKALFRPMSMMVPDYALIAEVILYSEGFVSSKGLAKKMVHMYKLCSEQLSQQDHYDFGMRAVKSVLVMAGALKRAAPDQHEDITLISALRDSNLPKFLSDDAVLFAGIISDLFPGVELPAVLSDDLLDSIVHVMHARNLQPVPAMCTKTVQLYETMGVRWGVMLVGPTGGGKTSVLHGLAGSLNKLHADGVEGPYYRRVCMRTLNPKAISADELYGAVNSQTLEWKDGLLGLAVRQAVVVTVEEHQWIVCDGPVDAVWIENLNTVLDDNKMLCLANSERIKLTAWVHMVFEVQDLAQASPATVSRCGMVYVDPGELGWQPLVASWRTTKPVMERFGEDLLEFLTILFEEYLENTLRFARRNCTYAIAQVEVSKVSMMCTLLNAIGGDVKLLHGQSLVMTHPFVVKLFVWAMLWSVGGNFDEESRVKLEQFVREASGSGPTRDTMVQIPTSSLWNWKLNLTTFEWEPWSNIVDKFAFDPTQPFVDTLVPTVDTAAFGYIAETMLRNDRPVMFTGDTGVGKSVLARGALRRLAVQHDMLSAFLNFSAQTSSLAAQEMLESRLEKRRRTLLGPPIGKRLICFVDDVNMPKLDTYGSQPPIELLRQVVDFHGLYDRDKMYWKDIEAVVLGCACAPPGGGRNPLTARFVRHFALLQLGAPSPTTLQAIFGAIIGGFLDDFNVILQPLAQPIVQAAVAVYGRIACELLPTPDKSHYVFNLRDLSKCIQGVLQADSSTYTTSTQLLRLFHHEAMRVFHDRLINEADQSHFRQLLHEVSAANFEQPAVKQGEQIIFGDFIHFGQARSERIYEEIADMARLQSVLLDYLDDWNGASGQDVRLILFSDAVQHITRLARLLRAERANGLLVGLSGMGKQSLTRLASHINGYRCIQIELTRGYDGVAFRDDLRRLYWQAGVENAPTVFLMADTQIVHEEFLEDVNNILNSGEVPGLYEGDEYERMLLGMREAAAQAKLEDQSRDGLFAFFVQRVRANLHVVLCMSPVGGAFRRRCRMFPSLVNCCTIDWFVKWPPDALYTVAIGSLQNASADGGSERTPEMIHILAETCVMMHATVETAAEKLFEEYRRHYYTTPSSFLELLKLYHGLLKKRIDLVTAKRARLSNGLSRILETNKLVDVMQVTLRDMAPALEKQSRAMSELLQKLAVDNSVADTFKRRVLVDEADATEKAGIARGIADDANRDLAVAQPALLAAEEALKAINKKDIMELKSFAQPPTLVKFVMEAVCVLFGAKPSWEASKKFLSDVNFLKRLMEFDKEHVTEATLQKLRAFVEHKDWDPAKIEKVSLVAKSVSLWVVAMDQFAKIYRVVGPKIKRATEAESELRGIMAILKQKQTELAEIEAHLQLLKDNIDEKNREFRLIQDNVDLTTGRLNRAGRLTSALADEEVRWAQICKDLSGELWAIPGDVLIASAYVTYVGAFPVSYRRELCTRWVKQCQQLNIPSSKEFSLVGVLGDAYEIRTWNMCQLPRDEVSIENGIVVTKALRWPLMVDPQEQANRWIRALETPNELRITKITDPMLMRQLEICIRQGLPMLIEDIEEAIDPALGPILSRSITVLAGRSTIKLGDTEVDYNNDFRLYITTKLSNPHYLPEVCVQVTLVNFLVTVAGLEDQLLAEIVAIELPALELQRSTLIVRINEDRQQLLLLEDRVLKLLFTAQGNILDDEVLVETLNESKETSAIIAARLIDTVDTEIMITATRDKYRHLSIRGAALYFVVATLAEIDPMYQFSLKYFTSVFCAVVAAKHEPLVLQERLVQLLDATVYAIYCSVARGLFERHKMVFGLLLAVAIEMQEGRIRTTEFEFFLRGPPVATATDATAKKRPDDVKISEAAWSGCQYLEKMFPQFIGLCGDLPHKVFRIEIGSGYVETVYFTVNQPTSLSLCCTAWKPFDHLIFVRLLAPEMGTAAISAFIQTTLGDQFTDASGANSTLPALFADTSPVVPLVFILSAGSDPMASLLRFTADRERTDCFSAISLGQGQGPAAERMITRARQLGHWVFLQNCHLATSWMASLALIVRELALGQLTAHPDFRLYLSSMPSLTFPVSVLQNSVKVTNEPPRGLRATLLRALDEMDAAFFEQHALQDRWRAMVFGLCMFHGVVLERRRFGPLGWNITYEFSEPDRESGLRTLDVYCDRENGGVAIPWPALECINADVTWGGRVTDYWDQRCLRTILQTFSSAPAVEPGYKYSPSGVYRCPGGPDAQTVAAFREYAARLPGEDAPEIFGMHENANLVYQTKETQFVVDTILEGQPRSSGGGGGASDNDDIVMGMIEQIGATLTTKISSDNPYKAQMQLDDRGRVPSITTVLLQETDRFNRLLGVVHDSLAQLDRAIRGFVVMSEALEAVYAALLSNRIPALWAKKGFLSTKSLAGWVYDFKMRCDYIQTWMNNGLPPSTWLSGLFFPQSFLTGTLQTHARRTGQPIDALLLDFEVLPQTLMQSEIYEARTKAGEQESESLYKFVKHPASGVVVHGLFVEAGRWDSKMGGLSDSMPGVLVAPLPAVWIKPCTELHLDKRYESPLYKTQVRAGVLSTTGHSTNFVMTVFLKSSKPANFWILRGTALVTAVTE